MDLSLAIRPETVNLGGTATASSHVDEGFFISQQKGAIVVDENIGMINKEEVMRHTRPHYGPSGLEAVARDENRHRTCDQERFLL